MSVTLNVLRNSRQEIKKMKQTVLKLLTFVMAFFAIIFVGNDVLSWYRTGLEPVARSGIITDMLFFIATLMLIVQIDLRQRLDALVGRFNESQRVKPKQDDTKQPVIKEVIEPVSAPVVKKKAPRRKK